MEQHFGKTIPSLVKDPFNAKCIEAINMSFYRSVLDKNHLIFKGYVEFKNGNTEGKQSFKASNLGELYEKIAEFCKSLE